MAALGGYDRINTCGLFPSLHPEVLEGIAGELGTDATLSGLSCSFCTFLGQELQNMVLRTAFSFFLI